MTAAPAVRPARRRWGSFPTTADVGIWATGPDAAALLEGLGLGLFALMTDLRRVRARETRRVAVRADDPAALVVALLSALIGLHDEDGFVARTMRVRTDGPRPTVAEAELGGEPFDAGRHTARTEVKAATLHALRFEPARGRARVIVDI